MKKYFLLNIKDLSQLTHNNKLTLYNIIFIILFFLSVLFFSKVSFSQPSTPIASDSDEGGESGSNNDDDANRNPIQNSNDATNKDGGGEGIGLSPEEGAALEYEIDWQWVQESLANNTNKDSALVYHGVDYDSLPVDFKGDRNQRRAFKLLGGAAGIENVIDALESAWPSSNEYDQSTQSNSFDPKTNRLTRLVPEAFDQEDLLWHFYSFQNYNLSSTLVDTQTIYDQHGKLLALLIADIESSTPNQSINSNASPILNLRITTRKDLSENEHNWLVFHLMLNSSHIDNLSSNPSLNVYLPDYIPDSIYKIFERSIDETNLYLLDSEKPLGAIDRLSLLARQQSEISPERLRNKLTVNAKPALPINGLTKVVEFYSLSNITRLSFEEAAKLEFDLHIDNPNYMPLTEHQLTTMIAGFPLLDGTYLQQLASYDTAATLYQNTLEGPKLVAYFLVPTNHLKPNKSSHSADSFRLIMLPDLPHDVVENFLNRHVLPEILRIKDDSWNNRKTYRMVLPYFKKSTNNLELDGPSEVMTLEQYNKFMDNTVSVKEVDPHYWLFFEMVLAYISDKTFNGKTLSIKARYFSTEPVQEDPYNEIRNLYYWGFDADGNKLPENPLKELSDGSCPNGISND